MLSPTTFFLSFFLSSFFFNMKDLNPGSFSFSQHSIFKPISVPLLRSLLLPQCSSIPFSAFSVPTQVIWLTHFPKSFRTCLTLYLKLMLKLKFEIFMQLFNVFDTHLSAIPQATWGQWLCLTFCKCQNTKNKMRNDISRKYYE